MRAGLDSWVGSLRAAAEPTRLRLLVLCSRTELTVSELVEILGQSQPRVSRHLRLLCEAGLLVKAREGTNAFFRVATDGAAGDLVAYLIAALDADDRTLAEDLSRLGLIRTRRAETAATYFRKNAAQWDKIRSLYVDEAEVEDALLDLVAARGAENHLDIGTGTGRILELLSPHVGRGTGIDLSRDMLAIARIRLEPSEMASCRLHYGDMYRLPWPDGSFDLVTFHLVLHYAEDPGAAIAEAARVTGPGGRVIVADFAPHDLDFLRTEHAHCRLGLGDDEIAAWFSESGLEPIAPKVLPGKPLTVKIWAADRASVVALRAAEGGRR
ncbi:MAG: metalloregulator ArsR/SmtB family transcription factor [Alphaproteobacteria bacterium]|nr:metalloregulator ArsR/SmtB family transcription factor [Alphaproteobacteria bacterium]